MLTMQDNPFYASMIAICVICLLVISGTGYDTSTLGYESLDVSLVSDRFWDDPDVRSILPKIIQEENLKILEDRDSAYAKAMVIFTGLSILVACLWAIIRRIRLKVDIERSVMRTEIHHETHASLAHKMKNDLATIRNKIAKTSGGEMILDEADVNFDSCVNTIDSLISLKDEDIETTKVNIHDCLKDISEETFCIDITIALWHDVTIIVNKKLFVENINCAIINSCEAGATMMYFENTKEGDDRCFVIRDNGNGFPAKVLKSPLDAKISTKIGGHGIGLSSLYSMVRKIGGKMNISNYSTRGGEGIYSLSDSGSLIKIILPKS